MLQTIFKPRLALPDIGGTGIIRAISKPKRNIPALEAKRDFDAVLGVLQSPLADRTIRIGKRAVFVFLILKEIWIDGAGRHAITAGEVLDLVRAPLSFWAAPPNVQRQTPANPRWQR